jgi:hypothetical protein
VSILKQIDDKIRTLNERLSWSYYARTFVLEHLATFDTLPDASLCGDCIDFDRLEHSQVMEVIRSFPGRWKKEPNGERINYSITLRNTSRVAGLTEIKLRCYAGEPPPNCQVIYEDVLVPAQTVRKPRLICIDRPLVESGNGEVLPIEDKEATFEAEIF